MSHVGKVFRAGNSAAVRLPKRFGLIPGMNITLEQNGNKVTIAPADDPEDVRRATEAAFEKISDIWKRHGGAPVPMERDPDIFPDRPRLY